MRSEAVFDGSVDENADRYPAVKIYFSVRKLVAPATLILSITAFFGSVAFGIISGNEKLSSDIAMLWFLLCGSILLLLIYQLIRWNITRPAIIIDKHGFLESRYVSELIPWDWVAEISSTTRSFGRRTDVPLIEVLEPD